MTDLPTHVLRLKEIGSAGRDDIVLTPSSADCAAIAQALDILALRKVRFEAVLSPDGKRDWVLKGMLGATFDQACVVTLDPVTTRVDEPVLRRYVADFEEPEASEVEMNEDDTREPLPQEIDIAAVMIEALSLSLLPYPRKDGAEIGEMVVSEPGATPLTQAQMKPFAGLAALRDKMTDTTDSSD